MIRSRKHLMFIASLPCIITGREGGTQACHIRHGLFAMGMKPSDEYVVPMHFETHLEQHRTTEEKFYKPFGGVSKAKDFAIRLFENTGDEWMAREILEDFRHG